MINRATEEYNHSKTKYLRATHQKHDFKFSHKNNTEDIFTQNHPLNLINHCQEIFFRFIGVSLRGHSFDETILQCFEDHLSKKFVLANLSSTSELHPIAS